MSSVPEPAIDFERHYGVNAGYVANLFEAWCTEEAAVGESWWPVFRELAPAVHAGRARPAPPAELAARAEEDAELEPIRGVGRRIASNMQASLELPTATSVRSLPAKLLDENRRVLNEHLAVRVLGKASFTHLLAFAIVRALSEHPRVQCAFVEKDSAPMRRVPSAVNLGIAIDVPMGEERALVVPNIKGADSMDFPSFHAAYEDVVRRGREGQLTSEDYAGTTATLTNPGGFGTTLSVPRLMQGQGLIVAAGSIGLPPELAGSSPGTLAEMALGPVTTLTSTYDHRVIQGAESALFLKRVDELLQGADGFWESIFAHYRVPWRPQRSSGDVRARGEREAARAQASVWMLINAYRLRGWRLADLDPLAYRPDENESLDPASYGLSVWDLDRRFLCGDMLGQAELSLREILGTLRRAYCRRWTVEYMHITERAPKHWIRERVEDPANEYVFEREQRLRVLRQLSRAERFERFLHASYVGNKRFSLEGADVLIPALAQLLERAAEQGVEAVVLGMAHRGRLNVLANIMGKSYGQIFREFEGVLLPLSAEGTGDVKYHLGQQGVFTTSSGAEVEVRLVANPSHLEAVDPVVCGMTRALQDARGDVERKRVMAVLVHGDAAFAGQGVVGETFQTSGLAGYSCGGTVHLVINNQIGFTTGPKDQRTSASCTDVAKVVDSPVLHANGDYPESVLRAVRLAVDYRGEFAHDAVVDIVCYRRHGHNEGDEPAYTQPRLYARIAEHPTAREHYTALLLRRGALDEEGASEFGQRFDQKLREALAHKAPVEAPELELAEVVDLEADDPADYVGAASPALPVAEGELVRVLEALNQMPAGHVVHPKLLRQLSRRERMVRGERGVDWGCAEALAFGSLLEAGVSIRLVGQDAGRGTFSHRHAVIRDQVSEADHVPLHALAPEGTSFEVRDSLLSEEAALGFEYGYALARPEALVLWEAQFGDFANGAQIQIDQFLVSGGAKWRQHVGLVLLLPHGYDGQGPEHSSARPERFLAACSGGNLIIANCSTAAQYYHLLRRQGASEERRPLIVFTPKSLLRLPAAASAIGELAEGRFQELIGDQSVEPGVARRVLLCSGKLYHELVAARDETGVEDVAIVRLEQLYPFPLEALLEECSRHTGAELVWVQEEPRNQGAWSFVLQRCHDHGLALRYLGRSESSSPATGSYRRHVAEQRWILERALAAPSVEVR